jgi:hypothetical protein
MATTVTVDGSKGGGYIDDVSKSAGFSIKPVDFSVLDAALKTEDALVKDSLDTMYANVEKLGKIEDDLTKIAVDNPFQIAQLEAAKKTYGLSKDTLLHGVNNLNNPVALAELDRKMVRLAADPALKDIVRDQAAADTFYKGIQKIEDPNMQAMALADYTDYKQDGKGTKRGSNLNIGQYKTVDIPTEYVKMLDKVAPMEKHDVVRVNSDGDKYVETVESRDPDAVKAAMAEFINNPIVKNNLRSSGIMDEKGNLVVEDGKPGYFDIINKSVSGGDNDISYFKAAPQPKGTSSKSSKGGSGSKATTTTTDAVTVTPEQVLANEKTITPVVADLEKKLNRTLTDEEKTLVADTVVKHGAAEAKNMVTKAVAKKSGTLTENVSAERVAKNPAASKQSSSSKASSSGSGIPDYAKPNNSTVSKDAPSAKVPGSGIPDYAKDLAPAKDYVPDAGRKKEGEALLDQSTKMIQDDLKKRTDAAKKLEPSVLAKGLLQAKKEMGRTLTNDEKIAVKAHIEAKGKGSYSDVILKSKPLEKMSMTELMAYKKLKDNEPDLEAQAAFEKNRDKLRAESKKEFDNRTDISGILDPYINLQKSINKAIGDNAKAQVYLNVLSDFTGKTSTAYSSKTRGYLKRLSEQYSDKEMEKIMKEAAVDIIKNGEDNINYFLSTKFK